MHTVIKTENLGKKYLIRHGIKNERYVALRDVIADNTKAFLRQLAFPLTNKNQQDKKIYSSKEEFWAIKNVNIVISQGDRVGIIGRNGAGKSTLLKLISRITIPSEGRLKIKGRVASLLEVGTGFHPELTGRENIFLNGSILGMNKSEIKNKFDEIVAFADIEKFLDTPIKRYSSGMYVRLAFAVAAHLQSEIILLDEVLAVGDIHFQRKCLGKMGDLGKEGKTVIVISHNLSFISNLCSSAIWIDSGRIRNIDRADKIVQSYIGSNVMKLGGKKILDNFDGKEAYIQSVELENNDGIITSSFDVLSPINVNIFFCCKRMFSSWRLHVKVTRYDGIKVFSTTTWDYSLHRDKINPGHYIANLKIPGKFLGKSKYFLSVSFGEPPLQRHDVHENLLTFDITGQPFEYGRNIGLLAFPFKWKVKNILTSDEILSS
jgi:lipopolysaccharide transport system ATP-binding protein